MVDMVLPSTERQAGTQEFANVSPAPSSIRPTMPISQTASKDNDCTTNTPAKSTLAVILTTITEAQTQAIERLRPAYEAAGGEHANVCALAIG